MVDFLKKLNKYTIVGVYQIWSKIKSFAIVYFTQKSQIGFIKGTYEYGKSHRKNLTNVESTDALLKSTDNLNPKQSENSKFINKYCLNSRYIIHMIEHYVKVAIKSDLSAGAVYCHIRFS